MTSAGHSGPDPKALAVTEGVYQRIKPDAAILFGSRARGNYRPGASDVDIMLIVPEEPGQETKDILREWAEKEALSIYGSAVPVELVWFDRESYSDQERFVNTVVTRALMEGHVVAPRPEDYSSRYEDEDTEYQYNWTDYDNRLYHAEQHLLSFQINDELQLGDLLIGHRPNKRWNTR